MNLKYKILKKVGFAHDINVTTNFHKPISSPMVWLGSSHKINTMIKTSKEVIGDALQEIKKYQEGVLRPAKSSFSHFNENTLGGIYPGMIIVIAGVSEMGKTHFIEQLENDFLNPTLNPDSNEYILLRCNWEMMVKDLLAKRIKTELKIKFNDILFSTANNEKINAVARKEKRENIFYHEEATTPDKWYSEIDLFLAEHSKKKHILITLDHLALVMHDDQLKKAIDKLLTYANILKKKHRNVSFILVSQLNRDIEYRTDVRFLNPVRSDLYASDAIFHIADIIIVKHMPYSLGQEKYMLVRTEDFLHLREYMYTPNNTYSSFRTKNLVFYHYLKIRKKESDLKRIHIEKYDIDLKDTENISQINIWS